MPRSLPNILNLAITAALVVQLAGCGTLLYPQRRNQHISGRLDIAVVLLDAVGLFFFILPGVIAFAVDLTTGCIYLPVEKPGGPGQVVLKKVTFDPKHTSLAQLEKIIKDQTGYTVHLNQDNIQITRLKSTKDMLDHFASIERSIFKERLAFVPNYV